MEPGVHHVVSLNSLPGFICAPVVVAQHLKEKDAGWGWTLDFQSLCKRLRGPGWFFARSCDA